MKLYFLVPGVLLALAGLTFALQGVGVVGPQSSFMYRSPSWIVQGLAILLIGMLVILAGARRARSSGPSRV